MLRKIGLGGQWNLFLTGEQKKKSVPVSGSQPQRRVLIIGLDGATFDVLDPLMAEGRMPRMQAAIASGVSGPLRSTTPPITPAAWTTFLTGRLPGAHGIIDFERYDPLTNKLSFNSTRTLDHIRTIWQILGDSGLRVGSINVPMTYPATPVNGVMISGFETPGTDGDFVYPPDLKAEILERWPDPTLRSKWRRKWYGGDRIFRENLSYMSRSFQQGVDCTKFCGERFGWDVMMVVLKLVDNLQHKTWKYIDERWSGRNPRRRDRVKDVFEDLDRATGELLDYASEKNATVLIVSDHGHGSLEGKVQPNLLLERWGYLSMRAGGAQGATRSRYLLDRMRGATKRFARVGDIAQDLAVDFGRTRACVMHAGMAGFLYINLAGRQPTGIVNPSDYESLRDELRDRFMGDQCRARDPRGGDIQLFSAVHKPEELYGCTREQQPWMPDLILTPRPSLAVVRKIRGSEPVRWLSDRRIEGTHRSDGIIIATGPGVASGAKVRANIVDCAPTVLTLAGQPVPDDMQGRVITEIFEKPPQVQTTSAQVSVAPGSDEGVYSEEDLQKVTERLSDLGYLE